jgi:hypothetical protein
LTEESGKDLIINLYDDFEIKSGFQTDFKMKKLKNSKEVIEKSLHPVYVLESSASFEG